MVTGRQYRHCSPTFTDFQIVTFVFATSASVVEVSGNHSRSSLEIKIMEVYGSITEVGYLTENDLAGAGRGS
jgi:hypothetical protein